MSIFFRLTADTLKQLQAAQKVFPRNRRIKGRAPILRRLGKFSERKEMDDTIEAMEDMTNKQGHNNLHPEEAEEEVYLQGNGVAILGMIKNLQDKITVSSNSVVMQMIN